LNLAGEICAILRKRPVFHFADVEEWRAISVLLIEGAFRAALLFGDDVIADGNVIAKIDPFRPRAAPRSREIDPLHCGLRHDVYSLSDADIVMQVGCLLGDDGKQ
jgi:hypothetical protein